MKKTLMKVWSSFKDPVAKKDSEAADIEQQFLEYEESTIKFQIELTKATELFNHSKSKEAENALQELSSKITTYRNEVGRLAEFAPEKEKEIIDSQSSGDETEDDASSVSSDGSRDDLSEKGAPNPQKLKRVSSASSAGEGGDSYEQKLSEEQAHLGLVLENTYYMLGMINEMKLWDDRGIEIDIEDEDRKQINKDAIRYYELSFDEGNGSLAAGIRLARLYEKSDERDYEEKAQVIYRNIANIHLKDRKRSRSLTLKVIGDDTPENEAEMDQQLVDYATYKVLKSNVDELKSLEEPGFRTLETILEDFDEKELKDSVFYHKLKILEARALFYKQENMGTLKDKEAKTVENRKKALKTFEGLETKGLLREKDKRVYAELLWVDLYSSLNYQSYFTAKTVESRSVGKIEKQLLKMIECNDTNPEYPLQVAQFYRMKYLRSKDDNQPDFSLLSKCQIYLGKAERINKESDELIIRQIVPFKDGIRQDNIKKLMSEFEAVSIERIKVGAKTGLLSNRVTNAHREKHAQLCNEIAKKLASYMDGNLKTKFDMISFENKENYTTLAHQILDSVMDLRIEDATEMAKALPENFKQFIHQETRKDFANMRHKIQFGHLMKYLLDNPSVQIEDKGLIDQAISVAVSKVLEDALDKKKKEFDLIIEEEESVAMRRRNQLADSDENSDYSKLKAFEQKFVALFEEEYSKSRLLADPTSGIDPTMARSKFSSLVDSFGYALPFAQIFTSRLAFPVINTVYQFISTSGQNFVHDQQVKALRACAQEFTRIGGGDRDRAKLIAQHFSHQLMEKYYVQLTTISNKADIEKVSEAALKSIMLDVSHQVTMTSRLSDKVTGWLSNAYYGAFESDKLPLFGNGALDYLQQSFRKGILDGSLPDTFNVSITAVIPQGQNHDFGKDWKSCDVLSKPGIYQGRKFYGSSASNPAKYGYALSEDPLQAGESEDNTGNASVKAVCSAKYKDSKFSELMQKIREGIDPLHSHARDDIETLEKRSEELNKKIGYEEGRIKSQKTFRKLGTVTLVIAAAAIVSLFFMPALAVLLIKSELLCGAFAALSGVMVVNNTRRISRGEKKISNWTNKRKAVEEIIEDMETGRRMEGHQKDRARPLVMPLGKKIQRTKVSGKIRRSKRVVLHKN